MRLLTSCIVGEVLMEELTVEEMIGIDELTDGMNPPNAKLADAGGVELAELHGLTGDNISYIWASFSY